MSAIGTVEQRVVRTYRMRAARYDFTANLYYLAGFREFAYRSKAVAALDLSQGATVVEIGCGTGLNFDYLQRAVGARGRVVGVDLTDAMLDKARERVRKRGWENVELHCIDAARWTFPSGVDAVMSIFALSLSPRCDEVIGRAATALKPGGRMAIMDLKLPKPPWDRLVPLVLPFVAPFGIDAEAVKRRPWTAIQVAMWQSLRDVDVREFYGGLTWLASGTAGR